VRVLVVEDDRDVASFVESGLSQAGWNVDVAGNGKDGLFLATTEEYDALIVDRMLPGEVDDRVKGLKAGGDDYLTKPFAFSELLARLEALVRRANASASGNDTQLKVGDLEIDLLKREVRRGGKLIEVQPREYQLLEYLMRHADQVVTRTMLLEGVWNYHFDPQTNVIDVHVSRLRAKIDKGFERPLLHTIRGAGYRLSAN